MNLTIKDAYKIFREKYPDVKIGYSTFHKLKPTNVMTLSKTPLV